MSDPSTPPPQGPFNAPPPPPAGVPPTMPPGSTGYPGPYTGPMPRPEERTWGLLAHICALAGYLIPLGNILGPLIVWLIKKDEMPFVDDQGKESLNFQILMSILVLLSIPLWCILVGIVVTPAIAVINLIFVIIAAVQSNKGEAYRYPFNLRLIK